MHDPKAERAAGIPVSAQILGPGGSSIKAEPLPPAKEATSGSMMVSTLPTATQGAGAGMKRGR